MSKNTQGNLCSEDNLIFQKGFPHVPGIGGGGVEFVCAPECVCARVTVDLHIN